MSTSIGIAELLDERERIYIEIRVIQDDINFNESIPRSERNLYPGEHLMTGEEISVAKQRLATLEEHLEEIQHKISVLIMENN